MKKLRLAFCLAGLVGSFFKIAVVNSSAQVSVSLPDISSIPVVTIMATDPLATWSGSPGVFTVSRSGNPVPALNVYYTIDGTATNGVDYKLLSHWVQIPSGVLSSDIIVDPIDLGQVDTRTVVLTLTSSPLMVPGIVIPVNYVIGSPSNATVNITVGPATNIPPAVSIAFPSDGANFYTPIDLPIVAFARDLDGSVASVEFFADGISLGIVSNSSSILPTPGAIYATPPMPPFRPFVLVWSNAPAGANILLTAKATDNEGASGVSDPVSITITPGPPPPPTNRPPIVRITSPADGTTFRAPLDLPILAFAADPDGYVAGVEFFAGTNHLGAGHRITILRPPPPGPIQPAIIIVVLTDYWELVWSNVPPGSYPLRAVAKDNLGLTRISDPVNVTILPPLPPPTRTNVVNIVAVDPIAIEGTNCWPRLELAGAAPSWSNVTANACVWRYFTNCAPKSALLAVHRFGDTNGDLVVSYAVGGTATNGIDYVTLPGTVTIPAGRRVALIPVTPLDDGPPDITSTVILTLQPSTNYVIGRPARAAAIILDAPTPTPVSAMLPDGMFHLSDRGPDGAWFHIECTSDLLNWTPIWTNQVVNGSVDFIDPDASNNQLRFYRVVPEAGPPQY